MKPVGEEDREWVQELIHQALDEFVFPALAAQLSAQESRYSAELWRVLAKLLEERGRSIEQRWRSQEAS